MSLAETALPALLANENVPVPTVRVLRDAGLSVAAVRELMPAATDREVLSHARAQGLWLLTFDRDYGELVFASQVAPPPAILYLRQSPASAADYGELVLAALRDAEFVRGHLVVLTGSAQGVSMRRRALPVQV